MRFYPQETTLRHRVIPLALVFISQEVISHSKSDEHALHEHAVYEHFGQTDRADQVNAFCFIKHSLQTSFFFFFFESKHETCLFFEIVTDGGVI